MSLSPVETEPGDDYFRSPDGLSHLGNIGVRLRDLSAVLAEHGLMQAADHTARAYGCVLAYIAAQTQGNHKH